LRLSAAGRGACPRAARKEGLRGFLYYPAEGGPFPGVIILGGSEGSLFEGWARAFAANGFAALTLAWFAYPGLPEELVEIPLEYFDRAVAWMQARPQVRTGRLGLMGGSKGGELALLVASRNPAISAVVAMTPAAHMWEGHALKFFPDYTLSSWSLGGKPLYILKASCAEGDGEEGRTGVLRPPFPERLIPG
jgi:dipeptidyl aminopeptidase/acylaminoacyl peptidase